MAPTVKGGYGRCCVYGIEDLKEVESDYPYIGSCAKPLFARWGQHYADAHYKGSTDIQKLLLTRPFDFRPKILLGPFACASQRDLNTLEQAYISKYRPRCNMRSAVTQDSGLTLEELIAKLVLPTVELRVVEVPQWRQLTVDEAWFKSNKHKDSKGCKDANSGHDCGRQLVCASAPHAGGGSDASQS